MIGTGAWLVSGKAPIFIRYLSSDLSDVLLSRYSATIMMRQLTLIIRPMSIEK